MPALEFPAEGSCSVWFIPVYSCLLRVAGDLTGRTLIRALTYTHTLAVDDSSHSKHRHT